MPGEAPTSQAAVLSWQLLLGSSAQQKLCSHSSRGCSAAQLPQSIPCTEGGRGRDMGAISYPRAQAPLHQSAVARD